jgi:hypothetical protein
MDVFAPLTRFFVLPGQAVCADRLRWYELRLTWLALALVSVLPLMCTPLPPLGDLYSHIGRYHVMLTHGESPYLDRYYEFHWALIPNMGQDLLMVPVGRLLGAERGGILLSALILPATILGIRAVSIAAHGRVQPIALFAVPFVASYTYLSGFMNYHTGLVVVVWGLAACYGLRRHPLVARCAAFMALSALAWLCHLAAWGLLVVAVAVSELGFRLSERGFRPLAVLPRAGIVVLSTLLPVTLMLAGGTHAGGAHLGRLNPGLKWQWLTIVLRDEWRPLDTLPMPVIALGVIALLAARKVRLDPVLAAFAVVTFGLFLIVPSALMGGYYADLRLLPVVWIAALLACRFEGPPRQATAIAAVAIVFFALRMSITAHAWSVRGDDLARDLRALDFVPQGSRIFALTPDRNCASWANQGLSHLPSLAIVRRDAFVNTEWNIPGQHLMRPTKVAGPEFDAWPDLANPGSGCYGRTVEAALTGFPRDRFDFVWLFSGALPPDTHSWLAPLYRGPHGVLYAVSHEPMAATPGQK